MSFPRAKIAAALVREGLHLAKTLWRSLRQVWLESTGALYIAMGVLALPSAWKEWHRYVAGGPPWRILIVALFMVMTISFGVGSFRRARRLR